VHAEWTKFRTVRGWVVGMIVAGLLAVSATDHRQVPDLIRRLYDPSPE